MAANTLAMPKMLEVSPVCFQAGQILVLDDYTSSITNVQLEGGGGLIICIWECGRRPWTRSNGLDDLPGKKLLFKTREKNHYINGCGNYGLSKTGGGVAMAHIKST